MEVIISRAPDKVCESRVRSGRARLPSRAPFVLFDRPTLRAGTYGAPTLLCGNSRFFIFWYTRNSQR
jgi:hypothetical protein